MKPFVRVFRMGGVVPVATNLSITEDFNNKELLVIENTFEKKTIAIDSILDVEPLKENKGQFRIKYYYKGKINEDIYSSSEVYSVLKTFR